MRPSAVSAPDDRPLIPLFTKTLQLLQSLIFLINYLGLRFAPTQAILSATLRASWPLGPTCVNARTTGCN